MASTYLSRTSGTATNKDKCTLSVWLKRSKLSGNDEIIIGEYASSNDRGKLLFNADHLHYFQRTGGSITASVKTTRVFRDPSAWYHIVVAFDTAQSTDSDRIKFYINGVQETAFDIATYPSSGQNIRINEDSITPFIGYAGTTNTYFDGSMSHMHFTDGYAYDASAFGSTDATTGEWKINTSPSVTYGTNGFFILKDGNSVTDQSGNGNNFTVGGGTLTKTEDCPSNVFATLNPLGYWRGQSHAPSGALSKGNNTTGIGSSEKTLLHSTIGVSSGKWYWEAKSDGVSKMFFGICNKNAFGDTSAPHDSAGYNGIYYYEATPDFRANTGDGAKTTGISSITTGDVLGFALDMDNWALYIHKNGTYMNSGDPTSGSSKTGAISELFNYGTWYMRYNEEVFASCYVSSTSGSGTASYNFGNGYFGTTAVSSAGTNASNNGIFEHDVPAGYTALSTKGLNE